MESHKKCPKPPTSDDFGCLGVLLGGKCWYILQIAPWSILQNIANGRLLNLAARLLLDFEASIDSR